MARTVLAILLLAPISGAAIGDEPPRPASGRLTDAARSFIDKQRGQLDRGAEARQARAASFQSSLKEPRPIVLPDDKAVVAGANHATLVARRQPKANPKEVAVLKGLSAT